MDGMLLKVIAAGVIGAHGIGHVMGWFPAWGIASFPGMSSHSWLLSGIIGDGGAKLVAGVIFLVPTIGFLAAAVGLLAGQPWWRQVAIGSAVVSLAGTALYPQAFVTGSTIGSIAVNVLVLYGLVVAGWGTEGGLA